MNPRARRNTATAFGCVASLFILTASGNDRSTPGSPASGEEQSFKLPAQFGKYGPCLKMQIGSEKELTLLLDTGASTLAISEDLAKRLRQRGPLRDFGVEPITTTSATPANVRYVEVPEVRTGEFVASNCPAAIIDTTFISQALGERIDGLVGMALFASNTLILDFARHEVRVNPAGTRYSNAVVMPCEYQGYRPFVTLSLGAKQPRFVVDSGASAKFLFSQRDSQLPYVAAPVTVNMGVGIGGTVEYQAARLATNIHWGGLQFERPIVDIGPQPENLIGIESLRNFTLGFDQPNKLLWALPATNSPVTSPPIKSIGLSLFPDQRGIKVIFVTPGSSAWETNIFAGDYITAINDEPAKEWTPERRAALYKQADEVKVDVKRGGNIKSIKLKVSTLVE